MLPSIDVVFANFGVQRLMPSASFFEGHDERLRKRASDRFRIIGIDQEGTPEVDRGAGEAG